MDRRHVLADGDAAEDAGRRPPAEGRELRRGVATVSRVKGHLFRRRVRPPLLERGGTLRGVAELLTGTYPRFLFGGALGRVLPVFHLHEVTPGWLEPRLEYLAENGYRTVTADAIARFVLHGIHPGARAVALCFDDGWASVWTVAAPLLKRYGFSAIVFVIPGRMVDAAVTRPTLVDDVTAATSADRSEMPFMTWTELKTLHASGLVDVQSHGYSHGQIFCDDRPVGFVTPAFERVGLLDRPLVGNGTRPEFLDPAALGAPLYPQRSRLSDARRFLDDPDIRRRCQQYVAARGGAAFFASPHWAQELAACWTPGKGRFETETEQRRAIYEELDRSRVILNSRLGVDTVRHFCFPWGIAGTRAREAVRRVGYETAFADRWFGYRAARPGDDPYRLMRLNGRYIFCLPGRGRRLVGPWLWRATHRP